MVHPGLSGDRDICPPPPPTVRQILTPAWRPPALLYNIQLLSLELPDLLVGPLPPACPVHGPGLCPHV